MDGTEVKQCECGANTQVVETRMRNGRLVRRRNCSGCGKEFWTVEVKLTRAYHELDFIEKEKVKIMQQLSKMSDSIKALRGTA